MAQSGGADLNQNLVLLRTVEIKSLDDQRIGLVVRSGQTLLVKHRALHFHEQEIPRCRGWIRR
jgi:hypothetical protein